MDKHVMSATRTKLVKEDFETEEIQAVITDAGVKVEAYVCHKVDGKAVERLRVKLEGDCVKGVDWSDNKAAMTHVRGLVAGIYCSEE